MNIQVVKFNEMSFIIVSKPNDLEIKYLKNNFEFDSLHLDDYLHKTQVPKIETFKKYTLVVLDFPTFVQNIVPTSSNQLGLPSVNLPHILPAEIKKKRLFNSQVDFFIGKDYLVVLHDGNLAPINDIFTLCQQTLRSRNEYMGEGPIFLAYRIIDALVDTCFPVVNGMMTTIDKIDRELERKPSQSAIEDISVTRRNIVVFHTMIKPIIPLFKRLEQGEYRELNGTMQPFWNNVFDHLQKIWDRLEDARELIEGISESNESLLSYRNNEIVRFLTVITSIAFPFVIINNLYSMNVTGLPYAQDPRIIWILFGVIFVAAIIILT